MLHQILSNCRSATNFYRLFFVNKRPKTCQTSLELSKAESFFTYSLLLNSLTCIKLNFVLSGTIFSVTVVFYQRRKSKFWHAEKIDLERSFKMSTNLTCFAFVSTEIFSFKDRIFFLFKKIW